MMPKNPFEQFALQSEMRAFIEQNVSHARNAFDGLIDAANKAMGQWQGQAEAAGTGASDIAHKSMAYAERNMEATFDFAQKLMHAKDPTEVMRLQSEYIARQMQTLSSQAQELGQSAAKVLVDVTQRKPQSGTE
jgi:phasin